MDQVDVFFQLVHISVEANIVQQDYQKGIEHANWMVRLSFGDIGLVVAHNEKRLSELYVVYEANQLVLALPEGAPEVDDAEDTEGTFEEE